MRPELAPWKGVPYLRPKGFSVVSPVYCLDLHVPSLKLATLFSILCYTPVIQRIILDGVPYPGMSDRCLWNEPTCLVNGVRDDPKVQATLRHQWRNRESGRTEKKEEWECSRSLETECETKGPLRPIFIDNWSCNLQVKLGHIENTWMIYFPRYNL